jgi:trimeric autotransporter adhesin
VLGFSESGYAVRGTVASDGLVAVLAQDSTAGGAYAVSAYSPNGTAVLATGNVDVTGTVSKAGGGFKIDHPLDPANKYLYHSFVESPDMMNVYNGVVTLDGDGRATVQLPDWFGAVNSDYRYQLTALLGPAPDLHVSALIEDGQFSIAGGQPGQQVSWQVTGIRQDAWANANRLPVEADKTTVDRGTYLHPELIPGGKLLASIERAVSPPRPAH